VKTKTALDGFRLKKNVEIQVILCMRVEKKLETVNLTVNIINAATENLAANEYFNLTISVG